jgi:hypothetical protein
MNYFLKAGDAVKIGTTERIFNRIAALQTGCPEKIECVCILKGSFDEEYALHRRFAHLRLHGEWFTWSKDISEFVHEATKDGFNLYGLVNKETSTLSGDETWSQFMKRNRARSSLSIRQVGELLGLSKTSVAAVENGENPTLRSMQLFSDLYGERFTV